MSAIATQAPSAPRTYPATTIAAPPTASGTSGALMPLRSCEPRGQLPQTDHDGDRYDADEHGLDDEQRRDDHRAERDADSYGSTQVTARALLLRRGRRLLGRSGMGSCD